jgi:hypothetical protein
MLISPYRALVRLIHDRKGSVAALLAVVLPLLIGCAGLAVDVTEWTLEKRQLQRATDSAAIAGVYSAVQSSDVSAGVNQDVESSPWLDPRRAVQVTNPVPGRENDPYAVSVQLTEPLHLSFTGFFLAHEPLISASATATLVQNGQYCAFALGSDEDTGLLISANSVIEGDCGIATNSQSPKALKVDAGATVSISPLVSHGGISGEKNAAFNGRSYGLSQKDPYEDTEPPLVPTSGCPNMTANANNDRALVIEPGCYGNLVLNGTVKLMDGEYILNRGSLIIGPTASVSCDACTIFLTSDDPESEPDSIGSIRISEKATVDLSAPSDGPDAGIVIYQDRHANAGGAENQIGGNGFSKIRGLVYTPSGALHVNGTWGPDVSCARFIGRRLIFEGRIYIAANCSGSQHVTFRGTYVKLVA